MSAPNSEANSVRVLYALIIVVAVLTTGAFQNASAATPIVNQPTPQSTEQLILAWYDWKTDPCYLKFGLQNIGTAPVIVKDISVSDLVHEGSGKGLNSTISPGAERDYGIGTCGSSAFQVGIAYTLQVVTAEGTAFKFPVYARHPAVSLTCDEYFVYSLLTEVPVCPPRILSQGMETSYSLQISGTPNTDYVLSLDSLTKLGSRFTPNPVKTDGYGGAHVTLTIDLKLAPLEQNPAAPYCPGIYSFTVIATSPVGSGSIKGVLNVGQVGAPIVAKITTDHAEYTVGDPIFVQVWLQRPEQGLLTITPPTGPSVTYTLISVANAETILNKEIIASKPYGWWTATVQLNDYCAQSSAAVTMFVVNGKEYDVRVALSGVPPSAAANLQVDGIEQMTINGSQVVTLPLLVDTPHTISVDEYTIGELGVRYHCPQNAWTVNSVGKHDHKFNCQPQYELSIVSDPVEVGVQSGGGWFDANATAMTNNATANIEATRAKYSFMYWEIDGSVQSGNPISVKMDEAHTATAKYRAQYLLVVDSPNNLGAPQGSGYYDAGTTANFSVSSPIGFLVRQVFVQWNVDYGGTSPHGSMVMNGPHEVQAAWTVSYTQLYVAAGALAAVASALILQKRRKGSTGKSTRELDFVETLPRTEEHPVSIPPPFKSETASGGKSSDCRYCGGKIPREVKRCPECGISVDRGYMGR